MKHEPTQRKIAKIKIKIKSTIFETATRAYLNRNKVRKIKI